MKLTNKIEFFNEDCMRVMARYPDNHFDLAIVDPPYGLEWGGTGFKKKNIQERNLNKIKKWENNKPDKKYFLELKRISKNQIIWGGNYFVEFLGNCKTPIIWNKKTGQNSFADGEFAWTSFKKGTLRIWTHQWCGAFKDSERKVTLIHPIQKPIALYEWLLKNYSKKGQKIIDTHLGSGSSAIASYYYEVEFIGCEIDKDYFNDSIKRFKLMLKQPTIFNIREIN